MTGSNLPADDELNVFILEMGVSLLMDAKGKGVLGDMMSRIALFMKMRFQPCIRSLSILSLAGNRFSSGIASGELHGTLLTRRASYPEGPSHSPGIRQRIRLIGMRMQVAVLQ
jgi:hypothetical protein